MPKPSDLLIHRPRQRDGRLDRAQNMICGDFYARVEGFIECAINGFFQLGTAEIFGRNSEGAHVIMVRVTSSFCEMDAQDFLSFRHVREIHEKNLIQATFSQEFRW